MGAHAWPHSSFTPAVLALGRPAPHPSTGTGNYPWWQLSAFSPFATPDDSSQHCTAAFSTRFICAGAQPEKAQQESAVDVGGGGFTLPLLPASGPGEGGGPAAGAVVTAFDPLMWGRSSRKDSYSLPEEGKQGG